MKITKKSVYTNQKNTMEVNVTEEQYEFYKQTGDLPTAVVLTYEELEFLRTGATPAELDTLDDDFDDLEDEDDAADDWK